jgi:hypothetical protein
MRFKSAIFAVILIAASLTSVKAATAADALTVPKTSFPACSATRTDYCVESVTLQTPGTTAQTLTYQAYGVAPVVPTPTPTAAASGDTRSADVRTADVHVPTVDPYVDTTDVGDVAAGVWTYPTWVEDGHSTLGYAGLVIDAKAVNSFSNHLYVQVKPGKIDATTYKTNFALKKGTKNPANLSLDDIVKVKLRIQNFQAGVTMAFANGVSVDHAGSGNANTITIQAQAIPLAMAKATADCTGEKGVAGYTYNGIGVFVAAVNDDVSGFGIDGVSGDMMVETNGICSASTPTWDEANKTLTWVAAAPHFAEDGTTINQGAYQAKIPVADAKLLWGLTNPNDAATALTVSMTSDATNGGDVNTVKSIAVKNGFILISSTGYQYSKPTFKIAMNPKYKPSTGSSSSSSSTGSSNSAGSVSKKASITCVKGKVTKKVTAVNPKCPSGYKKKA